MTGLSKTSVLLTGATGFIGRHLADRLVEEAANVHVIATEDSAPKQLPKVDVFCSDILDARAIEDIVRKVQPKIIFHLAAITRAKTPEEEKRMVETNVLGTMNLLRASAGRGARFINMSTSDVYGTSESPCSEASGMTPRTLYGTSKMFAEELCEYYRKTYSLPVFIMRPFLVYGPGHSNDMLIPYVIRSALSGEEIRISSPESVRDPIFVSDVIEYLISAAKQQEACETVNAGTGKGYSVLKIAETILRISKSKSKLVPAAKENKTSLVSDTTRQKKAFGFLPKISLEDGITETIAYYRSG